MNFGNTQLIKFNSPVHYGWIVVLTTLLVLIIAAGVRSTPGVLIVPFEHYFGWNRAVISFALAINLLLYGLCGPFAAALMDIYGLRRVMALALLLIAAGAGLTPWMHAAWQLTVLWGMVIGTGSGFLSPVLGTVVANRWFVKRRGLVVGVFSAAGSAGQLIFLPLFSRLLEIYSWQIVTCFIAFSALLVMAIVGLIMRNNPSDVGLLPYGAEPASVVDSAAKDKTFALVFTGLKTALSRKDFWLLSGSFLVCGASSNGLIGTHFIPACMDHGMPEIIAAGLLSISGIFNLLGAVAAGWLSDKFDNRWLLFWFYVLRGTTLAWLPFELESAGFNLAIFIVLYGLDWAATIPPTIRLTTDLFGNRSGIVFGWMMTIHQLGAAVAAFSGGAFHIFFGSYQWSFIAGAILCLIAAGLVIKIRKF
ncbi:MAG TPA: MFS transporter [Methylomusa anaerophila]|uniref:Major Facilitator Superfamily protein n=1 Tax=Methylomusa anaerophila TaxID=1930071 RepID=A0A348AF54_9FIRM|nr:MFS transporter [Methylomusa anaerophila]BBB89702.1 major Facilitator Superfamily protein [Methylomusa anaerophila]HML89254.1 MFS transporter [Methylomusa anaerophila]